MASMPAFALEPDQGSCWMTVKEVFGSIDPGRECRNPACLHQDSGLPIMMRVVMVVLLACMGGRAVFSERQGTGRLEPTALPMHASGTTRAITMRDLINTITLAVLWLCRSPLGRVTGGGS